MSISSPQIQAFGKGTGVRYNMLNNFYYPVENQDWMIEVHDLTRKFNQFTAVEDLNLEVEAGEVLGFLGPNGAGKTTTIRMLAGIIAPTSGYAIVAGNRTDGPVEKLHETIGLLTESPGFYERLTARRNLEYFAGFYQGIKSVPAQVEKYLKTMGLWERREEPGRQLFQRDEAETGFGPSLAIRTEGVISR